MFLPLVLSEEATNILRKEDIEQVKAALKRCALGIIILGQDGHPIKRLDLFKLVFQPTGPQSYQYKSAILQRANIKVHESFSMRLFETEDKVKLLLVNSAPELFPLNSESGSSYYSPEACKKFSVLYFALLGIFSSPDERLPEEDLLKSLSPLEFASDQLESYLEYLIKRMYLTVEKEKTTEGKKQYLWGPRSQAEVDPDQFFERFLELVDSSDKDWPELKRRIDRMKATTNR